MGEEIRAIMADKLNLREESTVFHIDMASRDMLINSNNDVQVAMLTQKNGSLKESHIGAKRKQLHVSSESIHGHGDMKPTTYWETLTHMIKGNIGCGLLATGMAFKNGGLLFTLLLVFALGFISCYNQYILITMANKFKIQYNYDSIGFAETIGVAFRHGPKIFNRLENFVRWSIKMFIILTQLGFCCVYFMFISQSLGQICKTYDIDIDVHTLMIIIFPIILITALIRELKYIAPLSTAANISTFASLGLILYHSTYNLPSITERRLLGDLENLPLAFGTIVFSLEGIGLVLPLQQNMKKNERFLGKLGVLNISLGFVTFLIATIGFFGYFKYGKDVKESLTYNLDAEGSLLTQIVISCMIIGILCTYALQFFIPVRLLLPTVKSYASTWPYYEFHTYEYLLRAVLVFFTFLTAELIPHLDLFVSLVGAVGGTFLALIYSPLADIARRQKGEFGRFGWRIGIAVLSLIVGVLGFFVGTIISLKEIAKALYDDFEKT